VAFNPAGTRLLSCGYGGRLMVWNATSGQSLFEHELDQVTNFAAFAPDGGRIVVAGGDGKARFVDLPANAK
jgi:WD40 repeat protein